MDRLSRCIYLHFNGGGGGGGGATITTKGRAEREVRLIEALLAQSAPTGPQLPEWMY